MGASGDALVEDLTVGKLITSDPGRTPFGPRTLHTG